DQIACVETPPFLETLLENLFVSSTLQHAPTKIQIMDAQKIAARAVHGPRRAEVLVIILVQLTAPIQANLVEHPREIHHPARHFIQYFRIHVHPERQTSAS